MINFVMVEMTALRYFVPLIEAAKRRGIGSTVNYGRCEKYSDPCTHISTLKRIATKYGFAIRPAGLPVGGTVFLIESSGLGLVEKGADMRVLTTNADFSHHYPLYAQDASAIYMPHHRFAEHYKCTYGRNHYLGSPKYDVVLDSQAIHRSYAIPRHPVALVIHPNAKDLPLLRMSKINKWLQRMGYYVITKTRGKNPVPVQLRGDAYFEDRSWYPHTTMELISVSDLVINFDSTAIKECIMLSKPVLNVHVKPPERYYLPWLFEGHHCRNVDHSLTYDMLRDNVAMLQNLSPDIFAKARREYLHEPGGVSDRILDTLPGVKKK